MHRALQDAIYLLTDLTGALQQANDSARWAAVSFSAGGWDARLLEVQATWGEVVRALEGTELDLWPASARIEHMDVVHTRVPGPLRAVMIWWTQREATGLAIQAIDALMVQVEAALEAAGPVPESALFAQGGKTGSRPKVKTQRASVSRNVSAG
jgi:hypothetical protein